MRAVVALIVLLLLPASALAQTALVEVPVGGAADVERLERLGFDVTHDVDATGAELLLDAADRRRLAAAGYESRTIIPDYEATTRAWRAAEERSTTRSGLPTQRDSYRYPSDYAAEIAGLAADHPQVARRVVIGRSVNGADLEGLEIGGDVTREDGRPVFVVIGLHHAREWPSGEVNMEFAHDLVEHYGTDARITALLDRVRVFVFPVTNPDGFLMSRGSSLLAPGLDQLQRKNANEVDLNRNYGAFWGGNGASNTPSSDIYRGPDPWSEPESAAIHAFSQNRHITNFQSIHNIAALVLRPPGFQALGLAPDEPRLKLLGDRMAAATGYESQYGYQLYEVTGATEDWNYVAQNAFGYTVELGGQGSFQGPYATNVVQQYLGTGGRGGVREALLLAGEQAADARDHAVVQGTTRPGAILRLRKSFDTVTSPVCQGTTYNPSGAQTCPTPGPVRALADGLDTRLTVPASGRFEWHVTPSERPFLRGSGERWTFSCETPDGTVLDTRPFAIAIGERLEGDPCAPGSTFASPSPSPSPVVPALSPAGALPLPLVPPVARASAPVARTPSVSLATRQARRTVLDRGVLAGATCATACTLTATVRRPAGARGTTVLGRRTLTLRAGRRTAFRVKLTRTGRRSLVRYRHRRVTLRLDAPGVRPVLRGVQLVGR